MEVTQFARSVREDSVDKSWASAIPKRMQMCSTWGSEVSELARCAREYDGAVDKTPHSARNQDEHNAVISYIS